MINMRELFQKKLLAFLHDPIHKPFILMELGKPHEEVSKELVEILGLSWEEIKAPDWIASAMERGFLPEGAKEIKFVKSGEVIHPFSGKRYSFDSLSLPSPTEVHEIVKRVLKKSRPSDWQHWDDRKKFFWIWRNLIPLLEKESEGTLRRLWSLAPADTRIPDHSIFEHLKTTAAFFNALEYEGKIFNNFSLFLFTIGPVQSFIAEARKTQDLYWGSFILSYLSWSGIKYVIDNFGPDAVIFPDLYGQPLVDFWLKQKQIFDFEVPNLSLPTLPNRFLAVLPERDYERLQEIGKKIEEIVSQEWRKICKEILGYFSQYFSPNLMERFRYQTEGFFEIYWVAVPFESDDENGTATDKSLHKFERYFSHDVNSLFKKLIGLVRNPNIGHLYGGYYQLAEIALGMRKALRNFSQLPEKGRKCGICGKRNVLFYKKLPQEGINKIKKIKILRNQGAFLDEYRGIFNFDVLQPGEGLCGVCFVKRCADKYFKKELFNKESTAIFESFPSTAKIALLHWLKELESDAKREYEKLFPPGRFDEQLYYEENLTEKYFTKHDYPLDVLEKAKKNLLERLIRPLLTREIKVKQTDYYAVLMLDGDNMGKWVSGEITPKIDEIYHTEVWKNLPQDFKKKLISEITDRPMTPALHGALSSALKNYALEFVREIVEKDGLGKLVYAGGDDVLAFLNLHILFDVMLKLRAAFSGHINEDLSVDFIKDPTGFVEKSGKVLTLLGPKATASAGVVIAHYKTPLTEVLKWARQMEKEAKDIDSEKDAFAIAVLKHTGEIHKTVNKWRVEGEREGTIGIAKFLLHCLGVKTLEGEKNKFGVLSPRFIYRLREEFEPLLWGEEKRHIHDNIHEMMIEIEIKRVTKRALNLKSNGQQKVEYAKLIAEKLTKLNIMDMDNFLNFLEIIAFMKRELGGKNAD